MPTDGSEAWSDFQSAFLRKLELAQERGEHALFPAAQSPGKDGSGGFFLTGVDVPETEAFPTKRPVPPPKDDKRSESARAKKLVEKLLGRGPGHETIEPSNVIALRVEEKLNTLRGNPAEQLELKQRVQRTIARRTRSGGFAATQARHLENLKRFSRADRSRLLTSRREEAEEHQRATLARARELHESIRREKLRDQYRRHHRHEIEERNHLLKLWITGVTAHRVTKVFMQRVREAKMRRQEALENASLASFISSASNREKAESAFFLVLRFIVNNRAKIRRAKRTRAADSIVRFARDCRKLGNFRIVMRKFIWGVRAIQRYWRSFMACTAARVQLLARVWEDLEEDICADRQTRIIDEAREDDPEGVEEYFREQLQAQLSEKNSAGVTVEKAGAPSALDLVMHDGGHAKKSFRERACIKDMFQQLLDMATLRVGEDLRANILPEILFAARRKFKALCRHTGAVVSGKQRKETVNTSNVKDFLEGTLAVDVLFRDGDDDGEVDKATRMHKKADALVYKMPPAKDRFQLFSLIGRTDMLRYIQHAQRSQGTSESIMVDPDLIPPRPGKAHHTGVHKSVMHLSLGDRVFLNASLPGMKVEMPTSIFEEDQKKKKRKKKKKPLRISEDVADKIRQRIKAAIVGLGANASAETFLKKHDKDHSGELDHDELKSIMRKVLKITKDECSDKDIEALLDALDEDGEGSIGISEVCHFIEAEDGSDFLLRQDGDGGDGAPSPSKAP